MSPTAIIDYLRINEPEVLQSPARVRKFLEDNYKNLPMTTIMSVDRLARKYRNQPTELEKKLGYGLMQFK